MPEQRRQKTVKNGWWINANVAFTTTVALLLISTFSNAGGFPQRLIEGEMKPSLAPIIQKASPAVVNIATFTRQQTYNPLLQSPFFKYFFAIPDDLEETRKARSAGSGVIVNADEGYVLTNHHVIAESNDIEVNLQDGRKFKATLIGSDKKVDIALLKIDADYLSALDIADSKQLAVGDFVLAIGNPFGLGQTVTSGIVSATGRNGLGIQGYEDFIQTDASINPGNSGGALIDLHGRLVGINSAIIAPAGGNVGIGFAIPTEVTSAIMAQLIAYGEVRRGGIGARFQDLTADLAEAFSLSTFQGAVISKVIRDSAADRAGLKPGDIVIKANGRRVTSAEDMHNRIGLSPVGKTLMLDIIRDGDLISVETTILAIPVPEAPGRRLSPYLSGALLKDFIPADQEDAVGIILTQIDKRSKADSLGFETGDIIFGVNRTRVRNIEQLKQFLKARTPQAFRLRRGYEDLILYVR